MAIGLAFAAGATAGDDIPNVSMSPPDVVRIPIVQPHPPTAPPDAARFSHWAHDTYQCYSCHMSIFPMARVGFTHDDMRAGRFCGSCHNGQQAWSPGDRGVSCETCHTPTQEGGDIDEDDLFD